MSGYRDGPEQKIIGETLIIKELLPLVDKSYRTIATRDGRAICGFSMGGGGSIRLALSHPDLFSAAAWGGMALFDLKDKVATARPALDAIRKGMADAAPGGVT